MIAQKEAHVHKFNIPTTQKVLLSAGQKIAVDILKQFQCECGKTITHDLERTIK